MSNESLATKLQELFELFNSGALSKGEYDQLKSELLKDVNISHIEKKEPASEIHNPKQQEDGTRGSYEERVIVPPVEVRSNKINIPTAQVDSQEEPSNNTLRNVIIAILILGMVVAAIIVISINSKNKQVESNSTIIASATADSLRLADSLAQVAPFQTHIADSTAEAEVKQAVIAVILKYYSGLNNKTFDANLYFANNVERFITMTKTSPAAINAYINNSFYKEFVDAHSEMEENSYSVSIPNAGNYNVEYIEQGKCYRSSKHYYQKIRVHVKVVLNSDFKITYFQQYNVIENSNNAENIY
jgi:type II secretory pathway pseudopilin PulG